MVPVFKSPGELNSTGRRVCAAIGVFDGVHLGHQQILRQTLSDARAHQGLAVAVTFDRHPAEIIAPKRKPPLIYPLAQKLKVISELGVDAILVIPFDTAFSQLPAADFVTQLADGFGRLYGICVGSSFVFGHKRAGNVELLEALGRSLNFKVHGMAAVSLAGKVLSSTRIREAIVSGDLENASQMLGRPYSLLGQVVRGDQLGSKIGVPTANMDVTGLAVPPMGVYAVNVRLDGAVHFGVMNIGMRPTLGQAEPQLRVEAHLLDFSGGELYGREIEASFIGRIRDEMRFPSLDALRVQIRSDIEAARLLF